MRFFLFPVSNKMTIDNFIGNARNVADKVEKNVKESEKDQANELISTLLKNSNLGKFSKQDVDTRTHIRVWTSPCLMHREIASLIVGKGKNMQKPIANVLLAPIQSEKHMEDIKLDNVNYGRDWKNFSSIVESPFQAAVRMELFFNIIRSDLDNFNIENFLLCSNLEILKLFKIMWLKDNYSEFFHDFMEENSLYMLEHDGKFKKL